MVHWRIEIKHAICLLVEQISTWASLIHQFEYIFLWILILCGKQLAIEKRFSDPLLLYVCEFHATSTAFACFFATPKTVILITDNLISDIRVLLFPHQNVNDFIDFSEFYQRSFNDKSWTNFIIFSTKTFPFAHQLKKWKLTQEEQYDYFPRLATVSFDWKKRISPNFIYLSQQKLYYLLIKFMLVKWIRQRNATAYRVCRCLS